MEHFMKHIRRADFSSLQTRTWNRKDRWLFAVKFSCFSQIQFAKTRIAPRCQYVFYVITFMVHKIRNLKEQNSPVFIIKYLNSRSFLISTGKTNSNSSVYSRTPTNTSSSSSKIVILVVIVVLDVVVLLLLNRIHNIIEHI